MRIRPACSTTNSRPLPSPALVTSSGESKPVDGDRDVDGDRGRVEEPDAGEPADSAGDGTPLPPGAAEAGVGAREAAADVDGDADGEHAATRTARDRA